MSFPPRYWSRRSFRKEEPWFEDGQPCSEAAKLLAHFTGRGRGQEGIASGSAALTGDAGNPLRLSAHGQITNTAKSDLPANQPQQGLKDFSLFLFYGQSGGSKVSKCPHALVQAAAPCPALEWDVLAVRQDCQGSRTCWDCPARPRCLLKTDIQRKQ